MIETTTATDYSDKTYEEKLDLLVSVNILPFEVQVTSDRFNVQDKFKFKSQEDALEFCRALVEAARITHGETLLPPRWAGQHTTLCRTYTADAVFRDYESPVFHKGWMVTLYCDFPRAGKTEEIRSEREFVYGWRFGALRMADPKSKVFVLYSGRDCDGYSWSRVCEYRSLHAAAAGLDDENEWADGPLWYSVISVDDFETFGD